MIGYNRQMLNTKEGGVPELEQMPMAAIDLGSNSFHMVVARAWQNEIRIQESLSEKVQLGAGLDGRNRLTEEAQERALECLRRFAQLVSDMPQGSVRVVGTNTLRIARNARQFIRRAEEVLGHDIEVVAGREEARLIYLGVAHSLPETSAQRFVVDIGGGSTELIIGEGFEAVATESLHMGCVSYSHRFFPDGVITDRNFTRALTAARQEILSIEADYRRRGWQEAIGASGTIKAIAQVCEENGWSRGGVSPDGLQRIRKRLLRDGRIDALQIKGLRQDRAGIFPAGVAILLGVFEQLGLTGMTISAGALREGLLYDLLGRSGNEDVRERTIQALMSRHHVDMAQAERVEKLAMALYRQVAVSWSLERDDYADTLRWGALLHEVGFAVSHTQFHKHGAYLVVNSDLAGFSRQEQQMVALMVRGHRRKVPLSTFEDVPVEVREELLRLCLILRVAVRLHRARNEQPMPLIRARAGSNFLSLAFPPGWLNDHPLTQADFDQEKEYFLAAGYDLTVS